nr:hypothetical protein [uncultured Marinifilum sp.]
MKSKAFSQKLENCRVLIYNSSNADILPYLTEIGVNEEYLTRGKTMYQEVAELSVNQRKEYQEQSLAYDDYFESKELCGTAYKRILSIVKLMARDDENLQNRLSLGNRSEYQRVTDWISNSYQFYDALLAETDFLTKLETTKITSETLAAEKEAILNLKALRNKAISEKGQAQEATLIRNEKMEELEDYCYELKGLAKIALEDKPQYLESLGILVRS